MIYFKKLVLTFKLDSMKNVTTLLAAFIFFTITSCKQNSDVKSIMQDPEMRSQIMQNIIDDDKILSEFMDKMQNNQPGMQMMQGNRKMRNMMMYGNGMQMMRNDMMKDSTLTKEMMQTMMKDGKMMHQMMQMMHKEGMMGDECLKTCTKMTNDKGIIINDTKN